MLTELEHRIAELKEHMEIRNTHRRVKFIAARLVEILSAVQDSARSNIPQNYAQTNAEPGTLTALLRHEAMLADLLRRSDMHEEKSTESPGTNNPNYWHDLITELVAQWEEVRTELGRADHPTLQGDPPYTVVTLPRVDDPEVGINVRLAEQDVKIGQILDLVKSLGIRLATAPPGIRRTEDAPEPSNGAAICSWEG